MNSFTFTVTVLGEKVEVTITPAKLNDEKYYEIRSSNGMMAAYNAEEMVDFFVDSGAFMDFMVDEIKRSQKKATTNMTIRLNPDEKNKLQKLAAKQGKNVSAYIRSCCIPH